MSMLFAGAQADDVLYAPNHHEITHYGETKHELHVRPREDIFLDDVSMVEHNESVQAPFSERCHSRTMSTLPDGLAAIKPTIQGPQLPMERFGRTARRSGVDPRVSPNRVFPDDTHALRAAKQADLDRRRAQASEARQQHARQHQRQEAQASEAHHHHHRQPQPPRSKPISGSPWEASGVQFHARQSPTLLRGGVANSLSTFDTFGEGGLTRLDDGPGPQHAARSRGHRQPPPGTNRRHYAGPLDASLGLSGQGGQGGQAVTVRIPHGTGGMLWRTNLDTCLETEAQGGMDDDDDDEDGIGGGGAAKTGPARQAHRRQEKQHWGRGQQWGSTSLTRTGRQSLAGSLRF